MEDVSLHMGMLTRSGNGLLLLCFESDRLLLRLALTLCYFLLVIIVMLRRLLVLVRIHQLGGNLPLMSCRDRSVSVHFRFFLRSLFPSMEAPHTISLILVS